MIYPRGYRSKKIASCEKEGGIYSHLWMCAPRPMVSQPLRGRVPGEAWEPTARPQMKKAARCTAFHGPDEVDGQACWIADNCQSPPFGRTKVQSSVVSVGSPASPSTTSPVVRSRVTSMDA